MVNVTRDRPNEFPVFRLIEDRDRTASTVNGILRAHHDARP